MRKAPKPVLWSSKPNLRLRPPTGTYDVPRLEDARGYYRGLGFAAAMELYHLVSRTGATLEELIALYRTRFPRSEHQANAIKFALDPTGKRKLSTDAWVPFRSPEGWLFVDTKHFAAGMALVADTATIGHLDASLGNALKITWMSSDDNASSNVARKQDAMSIDIAREPLLSLSDAARIMPTIDGQHHHLSSMWRWCRRGVSGIFLEHVQFGRRCFTSMEAISRFGNALAAHRRKRSISISPVPLPTQTGSQCMSEERAAKLLDDAKI